MTGTDLGKSTKSDRTYGQDFHNGDPDMICLA
jgi:hypothetical protein